VFDKITGSNCVGCGRKAQPQLQESKRAHALRRRAAMRGLPEAMADVEQIGLAMGNTTISTPTGTSAIVKPAGKSTAIRSGLSESQAPCGSAQRRQVGVHHGKEL
jgi:hypothetical protein